MKAFQHWIICHYFLCFFTKYILHFMTCRIMLTWKSEQNLREINKEWTVSSTLEKTIHIFSIEIHKWYLNSSTFYIRLFIPLYIRVVFLFHSKEIPYSGTFFSIVNREVREIGRSNFYSYWKYIYSWNIAHLFLNVCIWNMVITLSDHSTREIFRNISFSEVSVSRIIFLMISGRSCSARRENVGNSVENSLEILHF